MNSALGDQAWTTFVDPQGFFRVEIPLGWEVRHPVGVGTLRLPYQGKVWIARTYHTSLGPISPPMPNDSVWGMGVTIRIEQFDELPPPEKEQELPSPTFETMRRYRVQYESDWLTCQTGRIRLNFQYSIRSLRRVYRSLGWEPPPPLTPDEERARLALVQRILGSLRLL